MKEMYYIQDSRSYVGNAMVFWGKNGSSYTCKIEQAGKYSKEEAYKQYKSRNTDIPWKASDLEAGIYKIVDMQYPVCTDLELKQLKEEIRLKNEQERIESEFREVLNGLDQEVEWFCDWIESYYLTKEDFIDEIKEKIEWLKTNSCTDYTEYNYRFIYNLNENEIYDCIRYFSEFKNCSNPKCEYIGEKGWIDEDSGLCEDCYYELYPE